jgi:hypothetical protein
MKKISHHQIIRFILCLLLANFLQQYATHCRIGLTFDSPYYVAAAQSFAEKGILLDQYGKIYTNWTPLFPILLSIFADKAVIWAKYLHLFSLLGTVFFSLLLSEKLIENQRMKWLFALSITFSTPLLLISSFLWSESVFVFLLSLLLYNVYIFLEKPTNKNLIIIILLSNLLYLQRNAGLFFIVGIGIFLLKKDFRKALIYGIFSLISFLAWQSRNLFFVVNTLDFRNNVFVVSGTESLIYMADVVSLWLLPNLFPLWLRLFFLGIFLLLMGYLLFKTLKNNHSKLKIDFIILLLIIFSTYILFMLALRMNVEEENERYLAPLHAIFLLLFFTFLDLASKQWKPNFTKIICIFLVLWLAYPAVRSLKNVTLWHTNFCKIG